MAIPRYAQTMLNAQNAAAAKQNAGPGTITNAYQNYMKSPLLTGLPKAGLQGLYRTGQTPRGFYSAKSQLDDAKLAAIRAQAAAGMQQPGGMQPVGPLAPTAAPAVAQVAPVQQQLRSSSTAAAPLVGGNKFFKPVV